MEAVKGVQGYWHATNGDWLNQGLKTFCNRSISPNYRRTDEKDARRVITCPKCLIQLNKV